MDKNKENKFVEEVLNWTLSGLSFYYRDCDIGNELLSKYYVGQIIRSQIFVDVSSFACKLMKNCRFIIASNKAAPLYQYSPNTEKWQLHVINFNSYFKVLDIYEKQNKTQIFLLHIPAKGVGLFNNKNRFIVDGVNIEEQCIEKARMSFDKKMEMQHSFELEEEEWIERTQYPIGLDDANNFAPLIPIQNFSEANPNAISLHNIIFKITGDNELNKIG